MQPARKHSYLLYWPPTAQEHETCFDCHVKLVHIQHKSTGEGHSIHIVLYSDTFLAVYTYYIVWELLFSNVRIQQFFPYLFRITRDTQNTIFLLRCGRLVLEIMKRDSHPKEKPSVMGVYEVERSVAKRVRGGQTEYFIQWQNYSPSENTWEPAEHLSEDLIALFENRSVDPLRADEYRERLALLFEKGLKSPTACHETVTMINFIVL